MRIFKPYFILSLIISFTYTFSSCQTPKIESIENVTIQEMTDDGIQAKVDVNIHNPKISSLQCKNIKINLFYNDVKLASGNSDEKVVLKAKKTTLVPFDIIFSLEILEKFGDELLLQDSILITGKFEGDFTVLEIHKKEGFEHWLKTKDILDQIYNKFLGDDGIDVSKKIKKITASQTTLDLKTKVTNTLSIPLVIDELMINVYKDRDFESKIGECSKSSKVELQPNSSEEIEAELTLSNLSTVTTILTGLNYYLKGTITILIKGHSLKVPIVKHIQINPLTGDVKIIKD